MKKKCCSLLRFENNFIEILFEWEWTRNDGSWGAGLWKRISVTRVSREVWLAGLLVGWSVGWQVG